MGEGQVSLDSQRRPLDSLFFVIATQADRCPDEVHLHISTLDNPGAYRPRAHVFFAERVPWMDLEDDLPRYEGLAPGAEPVSWGPLHGRSEVGNS